MKLLANGAGIPEVGESQACLQVRYQAGDLQAFEVLWGNHVEALRRQAYRQTGGQTEQAREAVSEVAVRLLEPKTRQHYDPIRPWKPWAASVLRNLIIDQQRRIARLPFLELDETLLARRSNEPDGELARDLHDCLDGLSVHLRQLLRGRYVDGDSGVDLAQAHGRSNAWVSRNLDQARELLRACMARKGYGEGP